jgi:predicted porin
MKKSIIALAVAGAMTVPMVAQADATLFGSVRYDITDSDAANSSHTDSEINRMRIGVKGEETMDSGLTAGYFIRMEAGTNNNVEASNDAAVHMSKIALYVAGDFGKIILGDADSPVQYAEGRQTMTAVYDGSLEVAGSEFTNGGISYESNVVNGFQFRAGVGDVDGADANAIANEDSYGLGLSYGNDLVDIAVGFGEEQLGTNTGGNKAGTAVTDDVTVWGIGAQAKLGAFTVGAALTEKEDYASYGSLSAKYVIDKLTLAGQYEVRDLEATAQGDMKAVNVSAQYSLGGNAAVTLGYIDWNDEAETLGEADELKLRYSISF